MSIETFTAWLETRPFSVSIAESPWIFPTLESVHVLALGLVVGSIAMMDLRLLDRSARQIAVTRLAAEILPWTWISFGFAVLTGASMFASAATRYAANPAFQIKLILLAAAGANMMLFHLVTWRSVAHWDAEASTPSAAKVAGGLSLAFWIGTVVAGRWVGFL